MRIVGLQPNMIVKFSLILALPFSEVHRKSLGHCACKMFYAIKLLFLPSTQKKSLAIDLMCITLE